MKQDREQRESQLRLRRQQVAFEAARLMARHGLQDLRQAKLRAARQLGIDDEASLPRDAEVREQLLDYQRLFRGGEQSGQLRSRREAAVAAMQFFQSFQPRLVGSVLDGTADATSPIHLQAFSDEPELFARFLMDTKLPASQLPEQSLRVDRGTRARFPAWAFQADGLEFEITVLPHDLLRQAPLGSDAQPMARASLAAVRKLLESGTDAPPGPDGAQGEPT